MYYVLWRLLPVARQQKGLGVNFPIALLEPRIVLPAKFHQSRPRLFPSNQGRRFYKQTYIDQDRIAENEAALLAQHQQKLFPNVTSKNTTFL